MQLYTFFRSSAAYRVRIALNLKALDYQAVPIHLLKDGGDQHKSDYLELNPQGLIPTLMDDGEVITQSLAILEFLEEKYPDIPLLPAKIEDRARVRSMALAIACDIHPLNNLRVLNYLRGDLKQNQKTVDNWYRHWVEAGFQALNSMVKTYGGIYCFGDTITLADVCLIPQIANARRVDTDMKAFPNLLRIDEILKEHPAFAAAAPAAQPDAEG